MIVTAELPFSKNGDRIDVRISANADAKSLAGGPFNDPLKAGDQKTYVIAQGNVIMVKQVVMMFKF